MRFRRQRKRVELVQTSKVLLRIAALLAVSWWGWRTVPEVVRYLRMERM